MRSPSNEPRRRLTAADWGLILLASLWGVIVSAAEIRFAPLPLEDRKVIHEQFQGLVDYLNKRTGHRLRTVYYSDYADIIDEFRQNRIDIAYFGPLPYAILKRDFPAQEPLVCFRDATGEARYTCSMVTTGDSKLELERLSGVKIGLTQPYSTCGYLAMTQMLDSCGLRIDAGDNTFEYAGSHSEAVLGVARGEYDVAGAKTTIAKRYLHLDLRLIDTSEPFPGFALVANTNNLDPVIIGSLRQALLELDPTDRTVTANWGNSLRNGAVSPGKCDYRGVEVTLEKMPWPIPGSPP